MKKNRFYGNSDESGTWWLAICLTPLKISSQEEKSIF
jgi:hypothetical protein